MSIEVIAGRKPGAKMVIPTSGTAAAISSEPLLAGLSVVHTVPGRIRFRYRANGAAPDAHTLQRSLEHVPGMLSLRANPRIRTLAVVYDPLSTDAEQLQRDLLACSVHRNGNGNTPRHDTLEAVTRNAGMLLLGNALPPAMRLPATLSAATPLFVEAAEDLRTVGVNSHVLEALAVGISTAQHDFTAANTTLFMLSLGEHLEQSIARRSDDLLRSLLRPDTGLVWVERDGAETRVPAYEVAVGETVIVGAGATIPVDGTVLGGEALVNQASMTGESVPVARGRGGKVLSGTFVEEGRLRIYAEHVGQHTAVARIADYVESSLASKSNAQLGASKLADRLVPGVLALAGATLLGSGNWRQAAAVLQADYACALKLATPVAFKSAMHRAGKTGILVKGADVLERLAEADTFVFDKTGTLTTGKLEVTDAIAFDREFTPDDLIFLAASVEEHYFHPLALAVVEAARMRHGRHFDHKEVQFIAAHGVASVVDGKRIVVGSRHFVEEDEGIAIDRKQKAAIARLYRQGKTLLYIGFGGRLLGIIALKDKLRDNAATTVARLRKLGAKRIVMLTGDHRQRAEELAHELGLDACHAELLPQQKAELVRAMKDAGARVAFVGDGINDAPALAGAHVGIAMQQGADVARLTSDIVLLEDDIALVTEAKASANRTMKLIATNYQLTVGINTAILAAAAFGRLSPIASSVLHNGATIGILLNALGGGGKQAPRNSNGAHA